MLKKLSIGLLISNILSIGYGFYHDSFQLGFADGVGAIAIFSIILSGYIFLDHLGYFDVFGYTFKKTYLVFSNKYMNLEEEDKDRFSSMYNYILSKKDRREKHPYTYYIFTALILFEGIVLNLIYIYR